MIEIVEVKLERPPVQRPFSNQELKPKSIISPAVVRCLPILKGVPSDQVPFGNEQGAHLATDPWRAAAAL